jgi:hypothetical protein
MTTNLFKFSLALLAVLSAGSLVEMLTGPGESVAVAFRKQSAKPLARNRSTCSTQPSIIMLRRSRGS